ncbi:MAG: hypothetical protein M3Y27_25130 [Acidobacteriota bacterium]|nr:hypothetical protein [Acidobacteriota bacterium]
MRPIILTYPARIDDMREVIFAVGEDEISLRRRVLPLAGRALANNQVYVQAFPNKARNRQISTDRGGYPAGSHNGTSCFFGDLAGQPTDGRVT